jgi:phosphohistidine phosphatase
MKMLFVLRHAKAEADSSNGDFSRKLTDRGEEDAKQTGKHIAKIVEKPDLIVSSDAARALQTAKIVSKATHYKDDIAEEHEIYEATVPSLMEVVRQLPSKADTVILVGHNPGLEGLVYTLAENREAASPLATATFVQLEANVDEWGDIEEGCARVAGSYTP